MLKPEQLQAISHNVGDIMVSASAGSGKTFVMIERAIRLITEGKAQVNEILAVTFTESAAAEMKEKLKNALIDKINKGNQKLVSQVALVSNADICTIHAFCGRLIRKYFFTVGISPDFTVCDDAKAKLLKLESIDKTFKYFYQTKESWFLRLCDRYRDKNRQDKNLRNIILSMFDYFNAEANPLDQAQKYVNIYQKKQFNNLLNQIKKSFNSEIEPLLELAINSRDNIDKEAYPKLYDFADGVANDLQQAISCNLFELKNLIDNSRALYVERKIDDYTLTFKADSVKARDALKKALSIIAKYIPQKERVDIIRQNLLNTSNEIFKVLDKFSEIYLDEKTQENCLDFDDLQHFALKVLKNEQVLWELKNKYKFIFVDEYQDVNGVQDSIINLISNDNLFMVGDSKQSIYGFRGCRPEEFLNKFKKMKREKKKTVSLNHNFRSAEKILTMVNDIFSFCMTEEYFGEHYRDNSMLQTGGLYVDQNNKIVKGRAEIHFLSKTKNIKEKEEPRIYDVLEEAQKPVIDEENQISALIASIINKELGKEYFDTKEKVYKKITFGDIVILSRNKKDSYIPKIVRGLSNRGIPILSEVKQNVLDFPEIQMLVNALSLIDCFLQDVPLVSTLKSPIGKFTEEELVEISLFYTDNVEGKKESFSAAFEYFRQNSTSILNEKVKKFYNYIEKVRFLADFIDAKGILEKIISDCDIENYLLASSGGEEKVKRLNKFIMVAFSGNQALSLTDFLKKIQSSKGDFDVSESSQENAVRFMTMHASKGLEFPVVIICGTERKFSSVEERSSVLLDRDYGFIVEYFDDQEKKYSCSPLEYLLIKKMRQARIREEMRLFYVATTRATNSLHITIQESEDSRKPEFLGADRYCEFIPPNLKVTYAQQDEINIFNVKNQARKVLLGRVSQEKRKQILDNLSFVYKFSEETNLPLKTNVTATLQKVNGDFISEYVLFEDDYTDAEKGTIAHKILEYYDFNCTVDIEKQAETMVENGIITNEQKGKINFTRLRLALQNQVFNQIKNKSLYREQSFIVELCANELLNVKTCEKVLLQGIIDLLVLDGDFAYIIDYKYSSLSKESLVEKYKLQLELYSKAVEKVLNKKVKQKVIVNIFTGDVVLI